LDIERGERPDTIFNTSHHEAQESGRKHASGSAKSKDEDPKIPASTTAIKDEASNLIAVRVYKERASAIDKKEIVKLREQKGVLEVTITSLETKNERLAGVAIKKKKRRRSWEKQ
jgi:hypothetical protein